MGYVFDPALVVELMTEVEYSKSESQKDKGLKWDKIAPLYGEAKQIPHGTAKTLAKLRKALIKAWGRKGQYTRGKRSDIQRDMNLCPKDAEQEMTELERKILSLCDDIPNAGSEFDSSVVLTLPGQGDMQQVKFNLFPYPLAGKSQVWV